MSNAIQIDRVSPGSLFKLVFIGTTFAVAPLAAVGAVVAALGGAPVYLAGIAYTDLGGLFVGLLIAPFMGLSLGGFVVVLVPLGWWVYGQLHRRSLTAFPITSLENRQCHRPLPFTGRLPRECVMMAVPCER